MASETKTLKCSAPTNLAALHINGMTIRKCVTRIKLMSKISNLNYDYFFIDEISMVRETFYKFFIVLKRIKSNFKLVIFGNFNQLTQIDDRRQKILILNMVIKTL